MDNFEMIYKAANESIVPSADFADRTMETVFSKGKVRQFSAKKAFILVAAAVLLMALGACTAAVVHYIANKTPFSHSEHYSSNADQYTEKVNMSCTNGDLTVVLTEAVFENEKLLMIFDFEVANHDNVDGILFNDVFLKVDGIPVMAEATGMGRNDGYKGWLEMQIDLGTENLTGVHQFEITVDSFNAYFDPYEVITYPGTWTYTFSLDTGALLDDTVIFDIDTTITLYNGDEVCLDKIICNPMSQRLIYRVPTKGEGEYAFYWVSAVDRKGICQFNCDNIVASQGECINDNPDYFDMDAQSLTLRITVQDTWGNEVADPVDIICNRLD